MIRGRREPGAAPATVLPSAEPVVTLHGHGHVANLTAPDLLAAELRRFARGVAGMDG